MKTIALLKEDFEKHKAEKEREFDVVPMDMVWLMEHEKGGECVIIGMMDYLRITNPDGSKTKYFDLFEYKTV